MASPSSILQATSESASNITAKSRSNFSSSFFFLSTEKRLAIKRVYAFFRIIDDIVDEETDPQKQINLLNYWKAELQKTYADSPSTPITQELHETILRFKIPQKYFSDLIRGCEMDMTKKKYITFDELQIYCYLVASVVGLVCMKIFEYESPTSEQTAIDLGMALQLTNIIRDVGVDFEKGRIYLPQEDLLKFGVSETNLKNKEKTEGFLHLMDFEYKRNLEFYKNGFSEFKKDKEKKLLAARIMGEVYLKILKKIRGQNYPVLERKVKLNFSEKLFLLSRILASYYI